MVAETVEADIPDRAVVVNQEALGDRYPNRLDGERSKREVAEIEIVGAADGPPMLGKSSA